MKSVINILLQTTIATTEDDWHIQRFSLLTTYLSSLQDDAGEPLFKVTARDRLADSEGNDPVLSSLGSSEFDQIWLFAVDTGDGLTAQDAAGINAFHQRGGGIMATRDHQDLGCSLINLDQIGSFHFFHTQNPDPDASRHCCDDLETSSIQWPNYHSGSNGNYQEITAPQPVHELLLNPNAQVIRFLPAHPHEGAVGALNDGNSRVIAIGKSQTTGREFNLAVAVERHQDAAGNRLGRVLAESTFHHFCDYNWDVKMGCPSFVQEPTGNFMQTEPNALADTKAYVRNIALWLSA